MGVYKSVDYACITAYMSQYPYTIIVQDKINVKYLKMAYIRYFTANETTVGWFIKTVCPTMGNSMFFAPFTTELEIGRTTSSSLARMDTMRSK